MYEILHEIYELVMNKRNNEPKKRNNNNNDDDKITSHNPHMNVKTNDV